MTSYLFTFRAPEGYRPSHDTFDAWCSWQAGLGARLKDRGQRGRAAVVFGAPPSTTRLGGYSIVRAASLDAAGALTWDCPLIGHGGTVEIAELAAGDEAYDAWLDANLGGRLDAR